MKQFAYFLLFIVVFSSCRKEKTTSITPVNLAIKVAYDIKTSTYSLPLKEVIIKLKNVNTGTIQTLTTNDEGLVVANGLPVGTYDIDANIKITAANYSAATGIPTSSDITFNASIKNLAITVDYKETVLLKLVAGSINDWVIKQIYYVGSNTTKGAVQRDQFIEFYNNSDKVLYADSLYFAEITGLISSPATYNLLASGQLDWSKAVGMPTNIDANNDYVYSRALLMIPGTGKQYPVQPGKSLLVAQTGINHKEPFTNTSGAVVTVVDPSLTVDLSGADFEAYYGGSISNPLATDINSPVPNLEPIQIFGRDMIFDTDGRYSYILFKADASTNVKNLPQYPYPTKATPSASAAKYFQIPNKLILDAVEIMTTIPSERLPKKLNAYFDAGFTFCPGSQFSSQSVIRKTDKTVNGRIVLKDTNNSTEDFDYFTMATPRGFK